MTRLARTRVFIYCDVLRPLMLYNEALRPFMIYMRDKVRKREERTWRMNNERVGKDRKRQRETR